MTILQKRRYVLCPGCVPGTRNLLGPMDLARLYGVNMDQCEIYDPMPWWPTSFYLMDEERDRGLIRLKPRKDGNYSLPKQARRVRIRGERTY